MHGTFFKITLETHASKCCMFANTNIIVGTAIKSTKVQKIPIDANKRKNEIQKFNTLNLKKQRN